MSPFLFVCITFFPLFASLRDTLAAICLLSLSLSSSLSPPLSFMAWEEGTLLCSLRTKQESPIMQPQLFLFLLYNRKNILHVLEICAKYQKKPPLRLLILCKKYTEAVRVSGSPFILACVAFFPFLVRSFVHFLGPISALHISEGTLHDFFSTLRQVCTQ